MEIKTHDALAYRLFIASALELINGRFGALPASAVMDEDVNTLAYGLFCEAEIYSESLRTEQATSRAFAIRQHADQRLRRVPVLASSCREVAD